MIKQGVQVVTTTVILSVIAALSAWAQQPWLVPSLGASALVQVMMPREPAARAWNAGVGQLAGVAGGFGAVYLAGAAGTPSFMDHHHLAMARVLAVAIGIVITTGLQSLFKALNPAGAATVLVVVLGAETANWSGAGRLIFGIFLVTLLGETARWLMLKVS
jgi:hypothetical protein